MGSPGVWSPAWQLGPAQVSIQSGLLQMGNHRQGWDGWDGWWWLHFSLDHSEWVTAPKQLDMVVWSCLARPPQPPLSCICCGVRLRRVQLAVSQQPAHSLRTTFVVTPAADISDRLRASIPSQGPWRPVGSVSATHPIATPRSSPRPSGSWIWRPSPRSRVQTGPLRC